MSLSMLISFAMPFWFGFGEMEIARDRSIETTAVTNTLPHENYATVRPRVRKARARARGPPGRTASQKLNK